jgi:hypothetical protein
VIVSNLGKEVLTQRQRLFQSHVFLSWSSKIMILFLAIISHQLLFSFFHIIKLKGRLSNVAWLPSRGSTNVIFKFRHWDLFFNFMSCGHETTKDEDNPIVINVGILVSKRCVN